MKLQRYDTELSEPGITPVDRGPLVYHSEAMDWFESLLADRLDSDETRCDCEECNGMYEERARLRSLIAAERGKG